MYIINNGIPRVPDFKAEETEVQNGENDMEHSQLNIH